MTQHSLVQLYKLFTLHGWLCTLRDSQFKYSAIKASLKCCPCDGLQHETQAWVNMRDRRKINRWNLLCTVIIQSVVRFFFFKECKENRAHWNISFAQQGHWNDHGDMVLKNPFMAICITSLFHTTTLLILKRCYNKGRITKNNHYFLVVGQWNHSYNKTKADFSLFWLLTHNYLSVYTSPTECNMMKVLINFLFELFWHHLWLCSNYLATKWVTTSLLSRQSVNPSASWLWEQQPIFLGFQCIRMSGQWTPDGWFIFLFHLSVSACTCDDYSYM